MCPLTRATHFGIGFLSHSQNEYPHIRLPLNNVTAMGAEQHVFIDVSWLQIDVKVVWCRFRIELVLALKPSMSGVGAGGQICWSRIGLCIGLKARKEVS